MRQLLDRLYLGAAWISAFTILAIAILISAQIFLNFSTRVFSLPLPSTIPSYADFSGFMLAAATFLAMPYTFELNDVPIYAVQHGTTDEMFRRLQATLAVFEREAKTQPRVLTLALHPHLIGVPHVAHQFERCLDLLLARDDVVFMTSSEIGDWFVAADGTNGREVTAG